MSQPKHVIALDLPEIKRDALDPQIQAYFNKCDEKLGFVPNVLRAFSHNEQKLQNFMAFYDELMLGESELSKLEREMIAVAVSAVNRCFYCLVAHGAAVRRLSGDPKLGELLVMNYRVAELSDRQRVMLDFAVKLTERPHKIVEADRQKLRNHEFSEQGIWDISAVASFFNLSNRMASATDMQPNEEYHTFAR